MAPAQKYSPLPDDMLDELAAALHRRHKDGNGSQVQSLLRSELLKFLVVVALSVAGSYFALKERIALNERDVATINAAIQDMRNDIKTLLRRGP